MAGVTDTQSIRFGQVTDVQTHTMIANEADDIATQLDAADLARTAALKRPTAWSKRSAVIAIPVTSQTLIQMDTEVWDTHSMVDIAGLPFRVVVGATAGAGVYLVQAETNGDYTGWTTAIIAIQKNGTDWVSKRFHLPQTGEVLGLQMLVDMALNDYFTMTIYHEGGGTTNAFSCNLRACKMSN